MIKFNHYQFYLRIKPNPFSSDYKEIAITLRSDKYITARHRLSKIVDILNTYAVQEFELFDQYERSEEDRKLPF